LVEPDLDRKMKIEVDTSDYIMGEVLSMKYRDGKWRLVAYLSRSLNETKRNYGIHNKEILLVIRIFHEGIEVELTTSLLSIIPAKIQFHFRTYSRNKNSEDRWTK